MTKQQDPDDPVEMDKWIRSHFNIKDSETTDGYLLRMGVLADTPDGQAARLRMAYAWIEPQATAQSRPLIEQMKSILDTYTQSREVVVEPAWRLGQPLALPLQHKPVALPPPPSEADTVRLEQGRILFEQAKELHRLQPAIQAQERLSKAQSERASKLRAKDEDVAERIAKAYWDSKRNGTSYGIVKRLANDYNVSPTTIHSYARKYRPDDIDQ